MIGKHLRSLSPLHWGLALFLALAPVLTLGQAIDGAAWTRALWFVGCLLGTALSMDSLHASRWPMSRLPGGARRILVAQGVGCLGLATRASVPGLASSILLTGPEVGAHLMVTCVAIAVHTAALAVFLLQLRISKEARSMCLVLLAWAVPALIPATRAVLGTGRAFVVHPSHSSGAGVAAFAPIIVLLGMALLIDGARRPLRKAP